MIPSVFPEFNLGFIASEQLARDQKVFFSTIQQPDHDKPKSPHALAENSSTGASCEQRCKYVSFSSAPSVLGKAIFN